MLSIDIAIQSQDLSLSPRKTQEICRQRHVRQASGPFLLYDTGIGFIFRNNFANLGSRSCRIYNSLLQLLVLWSCLSRQIAIAGLYNSTGHLTIVVQINLVKQRLIDWCKLQMVHLFYLPGLCKPPRLINESLMQEL